MQIKISDHFTFAKLLRFTAPTAAMMLFTSIYAIVDGLFVANFVGNTEFAGLNFIYPMLQMISSLGMMLGSGGSALVAKTLGEAQPERANQLFSLIIRATIVLGVVASAIGAWLVPDVARGLGATGQLLEASTLYGRIFLVGLTTMMLQAVFQSFFTAGGRPHTGLWFVIGTGITNMALDWLLIVPLDMGLAGAAWATVIASLAGGLLPLIWFLRPNPSMLQLGKAVRDWRALGKACTNGSSEMMANIAMAVVGMLYNYQLLKYTGADGVAAYGIIMYAGFEFAAILLGFAFGVSPLIAYNHGARRTDELRSLFTKSVTLVTIFDSVMTITIFLVVRPVAGLFAAGNQNLLDLTVQGGRIYALAFLLIGFNILGGILFTALNNGLLSAVIAFCRTLVFECLCVLVLPGFFGVPGIWASAVVAEVLAFLVTLSIVLGARRHYGYL